MKDTLSLIVRHHLYMHYPTQIEALLTLKENKGLWNTNAVNLLFIPVYTTYVESLLNQIILDFLEKQQPQVYTMERLINYFEEEVHKASWETLKRIFHTVIGKELKDCISQNSYNAITILFQFRNQSVHGKTISHAIEHSDEDIGTAQMLGKFKSISEYFIKMNILTAKDIASVAFINESIVLHFFKSVYRFSADLYNSIIEPLDLAMSAGFKTYVLDRIDSEQFAVHAIRDN